MQCPRRTLASPHSGLTPPPHLHRTRAGSLDTFVITKAKDGTHTGAPGGPDRGATAPADAARAAAAGGNVARKRTAAGRRTDAGPLDAETPPLPPGLVTAEVLGVGPYAVSVWWACAAAVRRFWWAVCGAGWELCGGGVRARSFTAGAAEVTNEDQGMGQRRVVEEPQPRPNPPHLPNRGAAPLLPAWCCWCTMLLSSCRTWTGRCSSRAQTCVSCSDACCDGSPQVQGGEEPDDTCGGAEAQGADAAGAGPLPARRALPPMVTSDPAVLDLWAEVEAGSHSGLGDLLREHTFVGVVRIGRGRATLVLSCGWRASYFAVRVPYPSGCPGSSRALDARFLTHAFLGGFGDYPKPAPDYV